jgi:MoaA/NifB/PqqE/SkfB family radical SAM enzyme
MTQPTNTVAAPQDWVPTEVHDWEGKERDCLVLNYTMACALSCDFCCYGCHPKRAEKMPLDLALSLVEQAGKMGNFSCVGLTGGEVMLFIDDIMRIGDECKTQKLPITIATACHWATSHETAYSIIRDLAARGLLRLNLSCDPSHAKFVPKDFVVNAALVASDLGIPTYIIGTFYGKDDQLETFVPQLVDVPFVKLVTKRVAAVGRATKRDITQETYGLKLSLDDLGCYRSVYHDLVVFWDGEAFPCCSTFNRATKGIAIGNAFTDSLRELWTRAEGSLLFRVMKRQGFGRLYEIVKEIDPDLYQSLPSAETAVGPCSLCHKIFKNSDTTERLKRVFETYEKKQVAEFIETLAEKVGKETADEVLADFAEILGAT